MGKSKEITQEDRVLRHLQQFGHITSWEAIKEYGITRLSAKIFNLRREGYDITNTMKFVKNRYGEPVHFVEYHLENADKKNTFDGLFRMFGVKI